MTSARIQGTNKYYLSGKCGSCWILTLVLNVVLGILTLRHGESILSLTKPWVLHLLKVEVLYGLTLAGSPLSRKSST